MGFKDTVNHHLGSRGQGDATSSSGNQSVRNTYPAIVLKINDPSEQNRIIARIVNLDEKGEISGGRDRDVPDDQLPFCIPMTPGHLHIRPLVGEMVLVFLENPSDNSAPRYWTGPIITSKLKLKFQTYADSDSIFRYTTFFGNEKLDNKPSALLAMPQQADIALQGRDDADIILKSREAVISAGKFVENGYELNVESPCSIQLKQFDQVDDDAVESFSQQNHIANNINIYSPFGKFRDSEIGSEIESTNKDLKYLGELANSLHPVPFADELIVMLDLMVKVMLNHSHTPQKSLVPTSDSDALALYSLQGKLQELMSKHVRIN